MSAAVISLGSNMGDRLARLTAAVNLFAERSTVQAVSPVYQTPPWGPVAQDDYYNLVLLAADPARSPEDWLELCHQAERAANRVRDIRWGPRTLDADVIDVDLLVSADPVLTLPHPRAHERAFVLVPWAAIAPDAVLAGHGPIAAVLAGLDTSGVHEVARVR